MKWIFNTVVLLAALVVAATQAQAYSTSLKEYAFNVDGAVADSFSDTMPGTPNFNTGTGLGTISFKFGAGTHSVAAFFDHDIDTDITGFLPEFGAASGTAKAGQSWQIDEPGYGNQGYLGTIFSGFAANALLNQNLIPNGDDAAMAMGWHFTVAEGSTALVKFILGITRPAESFYLAQIDDYNPESVVYFNSTLTITPDENNPVPEPSTIVLLGAAMAGMALYRRKIRS